MKRLKAEINSAVSLFFEFFLPQNIIFNRIDQLLSVPFIVKSGAVMAPGEPVETHYQYIKERLDEIIKKIG